MVGDNRYDKHLEPVCVTTCTLQGEQTPLGGTSDHGKGDTPTPEGQMVRCEIRRTYNLFIFFFTPSPCAFLSRHCGLDLDNLL